MININGISNINKVLIFKKKKIINAPILKYPSFNEKFIIIKDVSYECIAEVLPIVLLTWKKQHLYIILQN